MFAKLTFRIVCRASSMSLEPRTDEDFRWLWLRQDDSRDSSRSGRARAKHERNDRIAMGLQCPQKLIWRSQSPCVPFDERGIGCALRPHCIRHCLVHCRLFHFWGTTLGVGTQLVAVRVSCISHLFAALLQNTLLKRNIAFRLDGIVSFAILTRTFLQRHQFLFEARRHL